MWLKSEEDMAAFISAYKLTIMAEAIKKFKQAASKKGQGQEGTFSFFCFKVHKLNYNC
jgi:hypothetical protein